MPSYKKTALPTLSIVIPAYNEERTIHLILDKVRHGTLPDGWQKEIILVNDYSTDNTAGAIHTYKTQYPEFPIKYVAHEVNKGKGAALHTGIKQATGDYIIIQDADLEYDPAEYPRMVGPIIEGIADQRRQHGFNE